VVGSLGQSMFSGVDLELDFGAQKLRLYSQKHCPGEVVYWARSFDVLPLQKDTLGDLYISVMANGKPMAANIATMNGISAMEAEAAEKVLGLDRSSAGVDATGGSDGCTFCGSITLKAQGLEIQNARVRMVQSISPGCHFSRPNIFGTAASYDCAGAFPLHIGMNVLTKLHLYFANGEKKLYFTDADVNAVGAGTVPAASAPIERYRRGQGRAGNRAARRITPPCRRSPRLAALLAGAGRSRPTWGGSVVCCIRSFGPSRLDSPR
jgi:hypothetical protein